MVRAKAERHECECEIAIRECEGAWAVCRNASNAQMEITSETPSTFVSTAGTARHRRNMTRLNSQRLRPRHGRADPGRHAGPAECRLRTYLQCRAAWKQGSATALVRRRQTGGEPRVQRTGRKASNEIRTLTAGGVGGLSHRRRNDATRSTRPWERDPRATPSQSVGWSHSAGANSRPKSGQASFSHLPCVSNVSPAFPDAARRAAFWRDRCPPCRSGCPHEGHCGSRRSRASLMRSTVDVANGRGHAV